MDGRGGARQSLLRYFHGRSSLVTWLRAVLSQRYVDRVRMEHRTVPLPEGLRGSARPLVDSECVQLVEVLHAALKTAIARLEPRDRLRLSCYYAQQLTLAQTGSLLKEHEATTSRQLARTRRIVREGVVTPDHEARLSLCLAKIAAKASDAVAALDQKQKLPDCLPAATAIAVTADASASSAGMTGAIYCSSPSGAFVDGPPVL